MEDTGIHVNSLNSHSSYQVLVYFIECMFLHWICVIRTISRDFLKVVFALFCVLKIFTSFCRYAEFFTLSCHLSLILNLNFKFQIYFTRKSMPSQSCNIIYLLGYYFMKYDSLKFWEGKRKVVNLSLTAIMPSKPPEFKNAMLKSHDDN